MSWKKNKNRQSIAILRVSSKRQEGNHSHELQEEKISQYCRSNSLDLVATRKIVESAKRSGERKKYSEAIEHALKNKILHVLFYMNDREARNLTDNEKNEQLVLEGKIILHYVNENKVLEKDSPAADFFMRDIYAVQNKNFSRLLSVKINDVMRKKAQEGWFPGNKPPLGYMNQRLRDSSGRELKRGTIIVPDSNDRAVKLVRREFELRATGLTLEQIRAQIIEEGLVEPSKSRTYSKHGIEARLKNKFYWGSFVWQGVEYEGRHEVIINKRVLDLVKESFGIKGSKRRTQEQQGIFSGGWLRCGNSSCSLQIVYDPKKKKIKSTRETKEFAYYRCSNSRRLHRNLKYTSEAMIWEQFSAVVDSIHLSEELAQRISDSLNDLNERAKAAVRRDIRNYESTLDDLDRKRDKLFDFFVNKTISEEDFRRQSSRIQDERRHYTKLLEESQLAISDAWKVTAQKVFELAINARSIWNSGTTDERLEYLKRVCSNPVLDASSVRYDLRKPFATIAEMKEIPEWRLRPN